MAKLPDSEVDQALVGLDGWSLDGDQIVREFQFADFVEALGFITQVGVLAERADHHPTITNTYNRVGIALWSHDPDGVTERDVALATGINARTA
ncbi:MAG TPA: 4a-hydroxytetrahydrobiopterin dehydratase [Dehalococcoidia bacterium]|jgi:4a-hydroxytetrahydrobiopterin dehydratase|nr:4a-hydroxytetrahydrobiopterin dehydratase [Dehalococcoidia bacterium]